MKKFFISMIFVFAVFMIASCGDGGSGSADCHIQEGEDCGGKTLKVCSEGEDSWYEVDGKKFLCDKNTGCYQAQIELTKYCDSLGGNGNNNSENSDDPTDSGENDPSDTPQDNEIPECSPKTAQVYGQSCKDSSTGLMWSEVNYGVDWNDAEAYCGSFSKNGFDDWRLPTISEIRTLVQNCEGTVSGGACGVTDECLNESCWSEDLCSSCTALDDIDGGDLPENYYSKLGDNYGITLWSSSASDESDYVWALSFSNGGVNSHGKTGSGSVRCVHNAD
ncbi:DUF1566 domain-containing protein [bacterium]|nr:DUF1566 domain-containing protein [bacterium]